MSGAIGSKHLIWLQYFDANKQPYVFVITGFAGNNLVKGYLEQRPYEEWTVSVFDLRPYTELEKAVYEIQDFE